MTTSLRVVFWEKEDGNDLLPPQPPDRPAAAWRRELMPEGRRELATLRVFFREWFFPVILQGQPTSTAKLFADSVRWWTTLTEDPPWRQIDDYTLAAFQRRLAAATYKRGLAGQERLLSSSTRLRVVRHLRTLFEYAGPQPVSGKPGSGHGLLSRLPVVLLPRVDAAPRRSWSLDQATAIFLRASYLPERVGGGLFWQTLLAIQLYLGLRIGDVWRLRWDDLYFLNANANANAENGARVRLRAQKTGKPLDRPLHPTLGKLLTRWGKQDRGTTVFQIQKSESYLGAVHRDLCQMACGQAMGWNVWRRTHAAWLAAAGYAQAVALSQEALQHSSGRTTTRHYADPLELFVMGLPAVPCRFDARQLEFF